MKVLAWLAFPLVATVLAMCWAAWRGRSRGRRRRRGGGCSRGSNFLETDEAKLLKRQDCYTFGYEGVTDTPSFRIRCTPRIWKYLTVMSERRKDGAQRPGCEGQL